MESTTPPPIGQPVPTGPVIPSQPTSTKSIMALILGILSLLCCGFFSGIPAIILGKSEINLIDEGKITENNRTIAKVGLILGIVGTAFSALFFLIYIVFIALGLSAGMMQNRF